MPAAFAILEARVNAAVIARLSNRLVTFTPAGGGAARALEGIFDAEYATVLDEMAGGSQPVFTCKTAEALDATRGSTLLIDAVLFEVVEPQPDGAGLTLLRLRRK